MECEKLGFSRFWLISRGRFCQKLVWFAYICSLQLLEDGRVKGEK